MLPRVCLTPNSCSRIRTASLPRNVQTPSAGVAPGVEGSLEFDLLLGGELGRLARLLFGNQRRDAAASIAADPFVNEPWRTADAFGDLIAFESFDGEQHGTISVPLQRPPLGANELAQTINVCQIVKQNVLGERTSVSDGVQFAMTGAIAQPNKRRTCARELSRNCMTPGLRQPSAFSSTSTPCWPCWQAAE